MTFNTHRISLSGLLNALDGIGAQEGRLLFATTNKYNALDPALIRPGRMDLHIEFKLASKYQARELYRCFYLPDSELLPGSHAQSQSAEGGTEKETDSLLLARDETASNASESSTAVPSSSPSPVQKLLSLPDAAATASTYSPTGVDYVRPHNRTKPPRLSRSQVDKLAAAFSDALPERVFSMASLQGYLMMYKTRPVDAVNDFAAWIERESREKEERERKEKGREEAEKEKEGAKDAKETNETPDAPTSTAAST